MTKAEWFAQATRDLPLLKQLLADWHPTAYVLPIGHDLKITAPGAEAACEVVRQDIRKNFEGDPCRELEEAIAKRDVGRTYTLLSQAWFGVPESRSCWSLPGFREAVDLMDDVPEDGEDDVA